MSLNLADTLCGLAYRWPDRLAIDAPTGRLSYGEMIEHSSNLATHLRQKGLRPGDRMGVAITDNGEAFVAVLAGWFCGASVLILDFRTRAAERQRLAGALKISFFIQDRSAPGPEDYPALDIDVGAIMGDALPSVPFAAPLCNTEDVAVIGVSSGTSGTPNPVALSHDCLYSRSAIARTSPQWQPGGRFLVTAPLAFSATRKHVISRLLDGGSVIFTPLLVNASELADKISSAGVKAMLTVPAVARELMCLTQDNDLMFPDLQYLMCCGAPMTAEEKVLAATKLSSGFVQNYGTTMAGMITVLETADIAEHSNTVGRPLPHVLTQIVDDDDNPLPAGETGSIRVRTPGVGQVLHSEGFDGKPRDSDLLIDGWVYPGDLGFLDDAGFLSIVGRTADLINRGGVNVYPSEIEKVLAEHPSVNEAAVVGWPDPVLGEEVAAFVVANGDVQTRALVAYCRSRLHPDKQPREIFMIDALPRNPNGKLVKRELVSRLPERGKSG